MGNDVMPCRDDYNMIALLTAVTPCYIYFILINIYQTNIEQVMQHVYRSNMWATLT